MNAYVEGGDWRDLLNGPYRCPEDRRRNKSWSYGKSVYSDLTKEETNGKTWPTYHRFPRPAGTVLFGELKEYFADHFMCHFWAEGALPEVDYRRHRHSENYAYMDGRVAAVRFEETYDPDNRIDHWHPEKAP